MANDELGPVELAILAFPGTRIAPEVVDRIREVVDRGYVRVLDLIYLAKDDSGAILQVEVDESLDGTGLEELAVEPCGLVSDDDLEIVRETMDPGTAAIVVVYEEAWARRLAGALAEAGGEMTLQVQIPRDAVVAALAAS